MKQVNSILLSLIMLAAAGAALGQTGNSPVNGTVQPTAIRSDTGLAPIFPSMFEPVVNGGLLDDTLVKNKPFAAAFESEIVEILPNGTSVWRRVTTRVYRDSSGRVRREQNFNSDGAAASPGDLPQTISIYDPVAGYRYSINTARRSGDRFKLPTAQPQGAPFSDRLPLSIEILRGNSSPGGAIKKHILGPPLIENLGRQTIAGVEAQGRRVTITVPAEAIGNANAVETVYETWIAQDLRMLVRSVVKNPVSGELNFRLTAINRAEQPRALFEAPASYRISEMGVPHPGAPSPNNGAITP